MKKQGAGWNTKNIGKLEKTTKDVQIPSTKTLQQDDSTSKGQNGLITRQ